MSRACCPRALAWTLLCASGLVGQSPDGWGNLSSLGQQQPPGWWIDAGLWSADRHGAPAPFIDTLGLGNGVTGNGVNASAGWSGGPWSFAVRLTAYRDALGFTRQDVDRGHFTYRTGGGGEISLEREPLLWGFGLNGGYVLGEASRPIPKVRLATPRRHLSLFGVPLGAWKGETFMGQLTDASVLPETAQSPSLKAHEIADSGTPLHPFLFGY